MSVDYRYFTDLNGMHAVGDLLLILSSRHIDIPDFEYLGLGATIRVRFGSDQDINLCAINPKYGNEVLQKNTFI
jgi:hypothetical protein